MSVKRLLPVASLALLASFTLVGCGSSDSDSPSKAEDNRPSVKELSTALQERQPEEYTKALADCAANVMYESDVSDETLTKLVEDPDSVRESESLPAADQKIVEDPAFEAALENCFYDNVDPAAPVPSEDSGTAE